MMDEKRRVTKVTAVFCPVADSKIRYHYSHICNYWQILKHHSGHYACTRVTKVTESVSALPD
ncbi:MAG: hypothetical protein AVDCRST_MAG56-136 [uncultured Cytophagales bacterium]|uniref:Uncharacterized protein n=1 Tax=uncultured Cytophagales bacterium TaxID=158755 RepID=A0A6J4H7F3_9SPHI|nr:MAG: hypothetical protein AVDCRST_MAG56-136 [uncultured Cytophagales bacterium]